MEIKPDFEAEETEAAAAEAAGAEYVDPNDISEEYGYGQYGAGDESDYMTAGAADGQLSEGAIADMAAEDGNKGRQT